MRIAIVGNMNNNGFAMLRYYRDLGVEAELFPFLSDGRGSLSHFKPENDTFEIERWHLYIHETDIANHWIHVLPYHIQLLLLGLKWWKSFFVNDNNTDVMIRPIQRRRIREKLSKYDCILTSGYGPAILHLSGLHVHIFSPYAVGVEGINRRYAPEWRDKPLQRIMYEYARVHQINALKYVDYILTDEFSETASHLENLALLYKAVALPMPMVYAEQPDYSKADIPRALAELAIILKNTRFSVMMHSRLAWDEQVCRANDMHPKNNHWVIQSFRQLIDRGLGDNAKLVILEYGPDLNRAKDLVRLLQLEHHVIWVPKTSRRNIMFLLSHVTMGVGEFIQVPRVGWGGTSWEVLAAGKPLLQGFYFEEGEYEEIMGYPEPPLLKVRSQSDVLSHLEDMSLSVKRAIEIGAESKEWFQRHNGRALAEQWLRMLGGLCGS